MDIIQNTNPKKNPFTSISGGMFVVLSIVMYSVKYLVPLFYILKQEVHYSDVIPAIMLFIGLVLMFMTDELFNRIFSAVLRVFQKKTNTDQ